MTHQVTEETRKTAENGAGLGLPHAMIATLLGITENTLRRRYRKELDSGKAKATVSVLQTLYKRCIGGSDTAIIWWTKTQLGWREDRSLELRNPPGQPFQQTYVPGSPELLQDYYAKLAQSAAAAPPVDPHPAAARHLGPDGSQGDEPGDGEGFSPR
jgi:hypothetical protein